MGQKLQGIRSIFCRYKIDRVALRIVEEMEKPKDLICMTHGHELREGQGNAGGRGGAEWSGIKGRKKWDNYNSITNKIYLKKLFRKEYSREVFLIDAHLSSWKLIVYLIIKV